jgi:hypothetical protein
MDIRCFLDLERSPVGYIHKSLDFSTYEAIQSSHLIFEERPKDLSCLFLEGNHAYFPVFGCLCSIGEFYLCCLPREDAAGLA